MELRQLRYLVTLADTLHFVRAAQALHIAQPTLSQQLQALEGELGVQLFVRDRRQTALTPTGEALVAEARRVLMGVDHIENIAKSSLRGEQGDLTLATMGSASVSLIPKLVNSITQLFPSVRVQLMELSTATQLRAISEGTVDVGFLRPPVPDMPHLKTSIVQRESLMVLLPESHLLAAIQAFELRSLCDMAFVLFHRGESPGLYDQIIALCRLHGFVPKIKFHATNIHTIMSLVAEGLGVSIVPCSFGPFSRKGVISRDISDTAYVVDIAMAWDARNDNPCLASLLAVAHMVSAPVASSMALKDHPKGATR